MVKKTGLTLTILWSSMMYGDPGFGQRTSSSKTCIYVSERFFLDVFASEDLGKMMNNFLEEHIFVAVGCWEKTTTR